MIGEKPHKFDCQLRNYIAASVNYYLDDRRYRRLREERLSEPLLAYLRDDGEGPPVHTRLLLGFDDLIASESFAESAGPRRWVPYPELHQRSVYCLPEIRAQLSVQTAEEWAAASRRYARKLERDTLPLHEGVVTAAEWLGQLRRLLRARGAVALLPHPDGSFPTPTCPEPPPAPPQSEALAPQQPEQGEGALVAAITEIQVLQREIRDLLVNQRSVKDFYSTDEAARALGARVVPSTTGERPEASEWTGEVLLLGDLPRRVVTHPAGGLLPPNTERIACCWTLGSRWR